MTPFLYFYLTGMAWQFGRQSHGIEFIRQGEVTVHQPVMFVFMTLVDILFWPINFMRWITGHSLLPKELVDMSVDVAEAIVSAPIQPIQPLDLSKPMSLPELTELMGFALNDAEDHGASHIIVRFADGQKVELTIEKILGLEFKGPEEP